MRRLAALVVLVIGASTARAQSPEQALNKAYDVFLRPLFQKDFASLKNEVLGPLQGIGKILKGAGELGAQTMNRVWREIGQKAKSLFPKGGARAAAPSEELYRLASKYLGGTACAPAAGKRPASLACALAAKYLRGGVLDKAQLAAFVKDAGAVGEELVAQAKELERAAGQAQDLGAAAKGESQSFLQGGMKAFEFIFGLKDRLKKKVQDLVWMKPPPESPTDTRNDEKIKNWFRTQVDEVTGVFNLPVLAWIPKEGLGWLKTTSVDLLAKLATPFIRLIQFLDGKIKKAVAVMIRAAMEGAVNLDAKLTEVMRNLGIPRPPPFLLEMIRKGADLLGRTLGSFGGYVLKLNPRLEAFVTDVVSGVADSGEALNDAMGTMMDTGLAISGDDLAPLDGEAKEKFEAGLRKLGAPSKDPKYRAAVLKLRLEVNKERYAKAFEIKREKVDEALGKVLDALTRAFTAFATPLLNQVSGLITKLAIQPLLNNVGKKIVTWLINLIPEAGGAIGAVWDVIAGVVIPVVLDTVPPLFISLALEFVSDWVKDLRYDLMEQLYKDGGALLAKFQSGPLRKFYEVFKVVKAGIDSLKEGLDKGMAAMLEGPVMKMLVSKLPPGLGELIATAVAAALEEIFKPENIQGGKFQLDLSKVLLTVLRKTKPLLEEFMAKNLVRLGANQDLVSALRGGLGAASGRVLSTLESSKDIGKLLQANVIRSVIADGIRGASKGAAGFLAGKLLGFPETPAELKRCGPEVKEGIESALVSVADLVEKANEAAEVFRKGFVGIVPVAAKFLKRPLKAFLSCGMKDARFEKFVRLLDPALDELVTFFAEEENVKKLLQGGLPVMIGLVVKVASYPIGVLLAEGLGDPELAGAIAAALRKGGDKLMEPNFLANLAKRGLLGTLVDIARIAKEPIILALARRFNDPDFKTTLETSYEELLQGLEPEVLAKQGVMALVQRATLPWARFAFGKAMDLLKDNVPAAKAKLAELADGVVSAFTDPTAKLAVKSAADAVVTGLGEGASAFADAAKTQCQPKIQDFSQRTFQNVFDCLKTALKTGAVAGADAAILSAVGKAADLAEQVSGRAGAALQQGFQGLAGTLKSSFPAGAEAFDAIAAAAGRVGDAALKAATTRFAGDLRDPKKCSKPRAAEMAIPAFLQSVGACVIAAAKGAFETGAIAGVQATIHEMVDLIASQGKAAAGKVGGLIARLPLDDEGDKQALSNIVDAAVGTGLSKFKEAADPACVKAYSALTAAAAKSVVVCLVAAAKGGAVAGGIAGVQQTIRELIRAVTRKGNQATAEVNKLLGQLPLDDQGDKEALRNIVSAAAGTGLATFANAADPACVMKFSALTAAAAKSVVVCLVAAAKGGAVAGGIAGVQQTIRELVDLVARKSEQAAAKATALAAELRLPGAENALAGIVRDAAAGGLEKFREMANPCAARFTGFSRVLATNVMTCLQSAVRGAVLEVFLRALDGGADALKAAYQANLGALKAMLPNEVDALLGAGEAAAVDAFIEKARGCGRNLTESGLQTLTQCLSEAVKGAVSPAP
jgi:hypothetical protein